MNKIKLTSKKIFDKVNAANVNKERVLRKKAEDMKSIKINFM